ncbi:hypothetical protein [Sphingosinicella rhizophila]|uniref:DUF4440 domain-containing protein n=1 Tax=Sphingosinicella rhizophila TaxID=3050082 RepID=A0ABU3Q7S7_9SPHN|nr:hypothetical protein [Sphingosinicella sp. GR2756]MDT9599463.1 hypothetical protein [Sphingosinicella sp. GR2756]
MAGAAPPTAVAAERAFAANAQTQGQWTAFRTFAADEAVMFTPEPVNAQTWLAGREDPPQAVMWWPARSFMSCDGTMAVNTGAWLRAGGTAAGYFTTVWSKRQDGSWKWLLDHGDGLAKPRPAGDRVRVRKARCGAPRPGQASPGIRWSADGSLSWAWQVAPDGTRRVTVSLWNGRRHEPVIDDLVRGQSR